MNDAAKAIVANRDIHNDEVLGKHAAWLDELKEKYESFTDKKEDDIIEIIKKETGIVFSKVLEHAGVFKYNKEGLAAFERFLGKL